MHKFQKLDAYFRESVPSLFTDFPFDRTFFVRSHLTRAHYLYSVGKLMSLFQDEVHKNTLLFHDRAEMARFNMAASHLFMAGIVLHRKGAAFYDLRQTNTSFRFLDTYLNDSISFFNQKAEDVVSQTLNYRFGTVILFDPPIVAKTKATKTFLGAKYLSRSDAQQRFDTVVGHLTTFKKDIAEQTRPIGFPAKPQAHVIDFRSRMPLSLFS